MRGTLVARRWSSQMSAGSGERPRLSTGMIVPRCVVTATPRTATRHSGWPSQSWRQACAAAAQKPSGSCSSQPGRATT